MSDSRREIRKSVQVTINCGFDESAVGNLFFQTSNISSGGALLKTALVLNKGTEFYADIPWPSKPDKAPIRVLCRVVHAKKEKGTQFMGIKFINMSIGTQNLLSDLYDKIDEKAEIEKQKLDQKNSS